MIENGGAQLSVWREYECVCARVQVCAVARIATNFITDIVNNEKLVGRADRVSQMLLAGLGIHGWMDGWMLRVLWWNCRFAFDFVM